MPSTRLSTVTASLLALLSLASVAAAQPTPSTPQLSPLLRLSITLVVNGVVGLIVVAAAPDYSERVVDDIRTNPAGSFLWGLLATIGGFIALIVLAITIIGLLVAIPGFLVYFVVLVVGGILGTVALGALLVDTVSESSLFVALAVGVVVSSILSLVPFVGGLANFVVSTVGIGAVVNRYWTKRQERKGDSGNRTSGPSPTTSSDL